MVTSGVIICTGVHIIQRKCGAKLQAVLRRAEPAIAMKKRKWILYTVLISSILWILVSLFLLMKN
jgi:hypothetical protein